MRILLILAGLALPLVASPQEIYRWVDRDGIVHYSDQPGAADAELVTTIDPNTYESEPSEDTRLSPTEDEPEDTTTASVYDSLAIAQPTPDQVFFGSDATVTAVADLGGASLRSDHSLVFFVNGNRREASGLSVELTGLARGSHFLRATVLDRNGDPVISSQQITFHVRQTSTQNPQTAAPPRPQVPRPTPTPTPNPAGN